MKPPDFMLSFFIDSLFFYTHECKNDEIAYFKVDINLIDRLPYDYLGQAWKVRTNIWLLVQICSFFELLWVMLGIVGNKVESVKIIGQREMNSKGNMKMFFDETDSFRIKPYFNDAKELFNLATTIEIWDYQKRIKHSWNRSLNSNN